MDAVLIVIAERAETIGIALRRLQHSAGVP
jgi:hypothetical protein